MSLATSREPEAASGKDPSSLQGLSHGLHQHGCADVTLHCMQSCWASQLHGVRCTAPEGHSEGWALSPEVGLERVWLLAEQPYTELLCVKKKKKLVLYLVHLFIPSESKRKQAEADPRSCWLPQEQQKDSQAFAKMQFLQGEKKNQIFQMLQLELWRFQSWLFFCICFQGLYFSLFQDKTCH